MVVAQFVIGQRLAETPRYRRYHGRSLIGGREVEIKVMRSEVADFLRRQGALSNPYLHELRAAMDMGSNVVARHLEAGTTAAGEHYLVREPPGGFSAAAHLADHGPFSVPQALGIVAGAAAAVDKLHALGACHVRLAADNVALYQTEHAEVFDVRLVDLEGIGPIGNPAALPADDMAMAPLLITPEQVKGAKLAPSIDSYGLGALLYTLLSGLPILAMPEPTVTAVAEHLASGGRVPGDKLKNAVRGLADEIDMLIAKCMRPAPADRPANAEQLIRGLHLLLKEHHAAHRSVALPDALWERLTR
jgi:serine/threonine protein kinase